MPQIVISREYDPMGVRLAVHSRSIRMIEAIESGLARYPDMGVRGELTMHVAVHDDRAGDPGWPNVEYVDDPAELVVRIGSSTATLTFATGQVQVDLSRSLCDVPDALRLLAESVFTAAAERTGELRAVHSALVVHDGIGLMLRGASGSGKSTLAYGCLRNGWSVCSADWVYASAHRPAGRFAGYPWRLMMPADAAARFLETTTVQAVPHPTDEGERVPVHPPVAQQVLEADVDAVVLLDPSPVLAVHAIGAREAIDRFWAPALPTEHEHLAEEWVAELLARPVFVLQRGSDPMAAVQRLTELAASLR